MDSKKDLLKFETFWNKAGENVKRDYINWDRLSSATDHIFNYLKENNFNWNDILMIGNALNHLSLIKGAESLKNKRGAMKLLREIIEAHIRKDYDTTSQKKCIMLALSYYHGKPLDNIEVDISNSHMISMNLKERFSVLENHGFKCIYCGRSPPEVKLELEHKTPKSKGGLDILSNFAPACFECNHGKSDKILKNPPKYI